MVIQRTEWLAARESGDGARSSKGASARATVANTRQSYWTNVATAPCDRGMNGSRAMGSLHPDGGWPRARRRRRLAVGAA